MEEEDGEKDFLWAKENMRLIEKIIHQYNDEKVLDGYRLGICLHITKETSVLLMGLKKLGAEIFLCSANPLSTQNHIASFLKEKGIHVYGKKGESTKSYYQNMESVLLNEPHLIIDDGGELHKRAFNKNFKVIGGTEETTTGINRLAAWQKINLIKYPVIAVNHSKTKYLFDNRYGTGQSSMEGILRTTGVLFAGKRVVVCGYGWVGKGVSSFARGLGAKVIVTEVNPIRALEAFMDGFEVKPISKTIQLGDIYITCTGQKNVIRKEHIEKMNDGTILANAGHFDAEIDIRYLKIIDKNYKKIQPNMDCYRIKNKKIYLLAEGRVINLVGGKGHPPEIMALSFANQMLSIIFLIQNYKRLEKKIYKVPPSIQKRISEMALKSFDIEIDKITKEQKKYFYT
ncbi:MAG: adenosylhomocysteinase [Thermoproteota archaeon]|nr:adenosylhomocysteinase [Thermoproteota archaeon]